MSWTACLKAISLAAMIATPALAKDYGSFGALFPVQEPSLLETIFARLAEMETSGELDEMRQEMQDKVRARVLRPKPVLGIARAEEYRTYEVDLSIRVAEDISDHRGVVFAKAGTVINPLDYSGFSKRLIFIDGDDPAQVRFALDVASETPAKIILINGEPLTLTEEHGILFFFDQFGFITGKFGIAATPAVVSRGYPNMIVEEFPVEEETQ